MIEDKDLGVKVAKDTDEEFWTDMQEKCTEAIKTEHRNIKVQENLLKLCKEQLS